MPEYPPDTESLVTVTFIDGEVKTYPISAGLGITGYLARELGANGALALFTKTTSHTIPGHQIREYEIRPYEPEADPEAEHEGMVTRLVRGRRKGR